MVGRLMQKWGTRIGERQKGGEGGLTKVKGLFLKYFLTHIETC